MGQNKLNSLMKTMAEKGGLSNKRLTITALKNAIANNSIVFRDTYLRCQNLQNEA